MPERSVTVLSYAAGASLAAVALVYVFAPTYLIDGGDAGSGSSSRKKGIVGLRNPANDCFINSVLQALAGLGELRLYLIRETHRRDIDDPAVYRHLVQPPHKKLPDWKLQLQQAGHVSQGLKIMLDRLNERPITGKKAISAIDFVRVLEQAFRQRISRQQQDAQEFLQIVAETLKEEYHAGQRARAYARRGLAGAAASLGDSSMSQAATEQALDQRLAALKLHNGQAPILTNGMAATPPIQDDDILDPDQGAEDGDKEDGFPMEGAYESHTVCQGCRFKTKPRSETFCTLTLNVPQVAATSLSACFDDVFKTEVIEDYKCDRCRLLHAVHLFEQDMAQSTSESLRRRRAADVEKLRHAIETDPEEPPADVELPDSRYAPRRKINRNTRLTRFPKILAVHLSRSIYDANQMSLKNSAKVAFPEQLAVGDLANRKNYRLLAVVTHKGSHHSGHYESFRRQKEAEAPVANSAPFKQAGVYSRAATPQGTPRMGAAAGVSVNGVGGLGGRLAAAPGADESLNASTPDLLTPSEGPSSSTPSLGSAVAGPPAAANGSPPSRKGPGPGRKMSGVAGARESDAETASMRSVAASARSALRRFSSPKAAARTATPSSNSSAAAKPLPPRPARKRKAPSDRWWRISDEKVRECRTSEVLGMQREVYLLFYELEKESA